MSWKGSRRLTGADSQGCHCGGFLITLHLHSWAGLLPVCWVYPQINISWVWAGKAFGTFLRATYSCCSSQSTLTSQLNSSAVSFCREMTAFWSRLCYAYQLMPISTHTGLICEGVQWSINSYMERTEVIIPTLCAVFHLHLPVLGCSGWMREMSNNLVLAAVVR